MNCNWKRSIAARIDLVAAERGFDASEIEPAKKRDDELIDFAVRHSLSIDWLLYGDLRGRMNMACGYTRFGIDITNPNSLRDNKKRIGRLLQLVE
jgi:hypothetical protein